MAIIVSKYAPHAASDAAFVDSRFYTTVSMPRTMEMVLSLPPMSNNDPFSGAVTSEFTGPGDQSPFAADYMNRDNGLIYTANKKDAPDADDSVKIDFRHADRADAQKLNVILWKDAMGNKPIPAALFHPVKSKKDDDY